MAKDEDGVHRVTEAEFRRQYEGRWEPPGPLSDAELERMERHHYRGNHDAYRLTMEVRRQQGVIAVMQRALREVEWQPYYTHEKVRECPCCLQADYQGHAGDCLLARALALASGEERSV